MIMSNKSAPLRFAFEQIGTAQIGEGDVGAAEVRTE